jgi:tripartite-type tricarboxylate transporter receptor subunit TctC
MEVTGMVMQRLAVVGFMLVAAAVPQAGAQNYPTRAVTFIVPYAAGGNTDAIARSLGAKLEQRLGQPFVIEHRLGAASVIGASYVARAIADGYTILLGTSTTMAINVSVYKNLPYDPTKDLTPVALIAGVPFTLVVNPSLPIASVADLTKVATTKAGGLSYASNGRGGAGHLFAELMMSRLGIQMTHVPYKGLAPALSDVVAGHVDVMFGDFATALPLVRAGKLRALGVSTEQRVATAPEIAPLAEAGLPGFDASSWQMVIAPGAVPKEILIRLNGEIRAIMSEPAMQADFAGRGLIPYVTSDPEELRRFVKTEIVRWGDVVKKAGAAATQ